ncbi:MAG: hypothetical protein AAFP78_10660 [Pseudomonadota bacterium]
MDHSGEGLADLPGRLTAAELLRAGELCVARLRAGDVEVGQEFFGAGIHEVVAKIGKAFLTKQLDPWHNDFTTNRHYWTTLRHQGELVGMSGARVDQIAPGEFVPFMRNQMRRLFSQGKDEVLSPQVFPPEFAEITGTVAYLGDFFVMPEHRGRQFDKTAYTLLLYVQAMIEWRFDWLYLFVSRQHGEKDYFARYCMPTSYPAALLWDNPPPERNDSDYIGVLNSRSFTWILRRFLARPDLF